MNTRGSTTTRPAAPDRLRPPRLLRVSHILHRRRQRSASTRVERAARPCRHHPVRVPTSKATWRSMPAE